MLWADLIRMGSPGRVCRRSGGGDGARALYRILWVDGANRGRGQTLFLGLTAGRYIFLEAGNMVRHWHVGSPNPCRGGKVVRNYPGPLMRFVRESVGIEGVDLIAVVFGAWLAESV